jgi:hypothetical protein
VIKACDGGFGVLFAVFRYDETSTATPGLVERGGSADVIAGLGRCIDDTGAGERRCNVIRVPQASCKSMVPESFNF